MYIEDASIILIRDFRKEDFYILPNSYLPYSLTKYNIDKDGYSRLDFERKNHLCYIKHKHKDLWLYVIDNKPVWKPLHPVHYNQDKIHYPRRYARRSEALPHYPTVFWLYYLKESTFAIYKPFTYNSMEVNYIKYNKKSGDISFVTDVYDASIFSYKKIRWADFIHHNRWRHYGEL